MYDFSATNSYFGNYGQYGLSGLNFDPTYSNYSPTKALNLEYIDTTPYYKSTNNAGNTTGSTTPPTGSTGSSWGIGDTLGTINAVTGSINAIGGIMSAYQNWEYMKQSIENMNQEYAINEQKFNDYKEDRQRLENMRTNTQKQFSTGSQVKTTY